jgi:hypothetical protein
MLALIGAFERSFAMPIALTHLPLGVCTPTMTPGAAAWRNPRRTAALSRARSRGGSWALERADSALASVFVASPAASSPQAPTSAPASRTCATTALPRPIRDRLTSDPAVHSVGTAGRATRRAADGTYPCRRASSAPGPAWQLSSASAGGAGRGPARMQRHVGRAEPAATGARRSRGRARSQARSSRRARPPPRPPGSRPR